MKKAERDRYFPCAGGEYISSTLNLNSLEYFFYIYNIYSYVCIKFRMQQIHITHFHIQRNKSLMLETLQK